MMNAFYKNKILWNQIKSMDGNFTHTHKKSHVQASFLGLHQAQAKSKVLGTKRNNFAQQTTPVAQPYCI